MKDENSFNQRYGEVLYILIDIFLFLSIVLIIFSNVKIGFIGYFLTFLSIFICIKVRKNEKLLFLFAILGFINISIGATDLIQKGINVASWQLPLRESISNIYTAKSLLLFLGTINLLISKKWLSERAMNIDLKTFKVKNNPIISYTGIVAMFIILVAGYGNELYSTSSYISNDNPFIEYSILIYAVVWMFSGKNKIIFFFLSLYAFIYVAYSLLLGDRSASFLMLLLYYLLFFNRIKLSMGKIVILAILAIGLSNVVAETRDGEIDSISEVISNSFERGLYSDTVSYSYYATITISAAHHIDDTQTYFYGYLKTIIFGGGSSEYGNLAKYVSDNYLYNVGGGLYTSYFYFGFGFFGVFLGALILGMILKKVYSNNGYFSLLFQLLIPVLSIRWYLYGPTTFYRSIFLIGGVLLLVCFIVDKLTKEQEKEVYNVLKN